MAWRGNLAKHVKELRFVLSGSAPESQGMRDFLKGNYTSLKAMNPSFPLLVRETADAKPSVLALYGKGEEKTISVANFSGADVEKHVEQLVLKK